MEHWGPGTTAQRKSGRHRRLLAGRRNLGTGNHQGRHPTSCTFPRMGCPCSQPWIARGLALPSRACCKILQMTPQTCGMPQICACGLSPRVLRNPCQPAASPCSTEAQTRLRRHQRTRRIHHLGMEHWGPGTTAQRMNDHHQRLLAGRRNLGTGNHQGTHPTSCTFLRMGCPSHLICPGGGRQRLCFLPGMSWRPVRPRRQWLR